MSLRAVNLNLIPVLQALLRERNLSRAALALHLTQPAVSAALSRLRTVLNDPLLVPVGRGMRLTPRALELIGPVEEACAALNRVLTVPAFDPRSARRTFVVSSADYACVILAPSMVQALRLQAPAVCMHFVNAVLASFGADRLSEVDLIFAPRAMVNGLNSVDLCVRNVLRDQFVYAVGPGHPLYEVPQPTAAELAAHRTVRFAPAPMPTGFDAGDVSSLMGPVGADGVDTVEDLVLCEQFAALPLIGMLSGAMTLAPRRLIEQLQPFMPLRTFDAGLKPMDLCMVWSPLHDADPGHRWFRELLWQTVSDVHAGAPERILGRGRMVAVADVSAAAPAMPPG